MNHFTALRQNQKNARGLLLLFLTSIFCIATCLYVVTKVIEVYAVGAQKHQNIVASDSILKQNPEIAESLEKSARTGFFDPVQFLYFNLSVFAFVSLVASFRAFKIGSLPSGLARWLKAEPLHRQTKDKNSQLFFEDLEKISVAAGTVTPAVYVLKNQSHPLVFTYGSSLNNCAFFVTDGVFENLNTNEIRAIIAQQFHFLIDGTTVFYSRVFHTINGLLLIPNIGRSLWLYESQNKFFKFLANIFGSLIWFAGAVFVMFARIIKLITKNSKLSQADHLASMAINDSPALISALKKCSDYKNTNLRLNIDENLAHMCFVSPQLVFNYWIPCQQSVIKRVNLLASIKREIDANNLRSKNTQTSLRPVVPLKILNRSGKIEAQSIKMADDFLRKINSVIDDSWYSEDGALAAFFCLISERRFLSETKKIIEENHSAEVAKKFANLFDKVETLTPKEKTILAELLNSIFVHLDTEQKLTLSNTSNLLIAKNIEKSNYSQLIMVFLGLQKQPQSVFEVSTHVTNPNVKKQNLKYLTSKISKDGLCGENDLEFVRAYGLAIEAPLPLAVFEQ